MEGCNGCHKMGRSGCDVTSWDEVPESHKGVCPALVGFNNFLKKIEFQQDEIEEELARAAEQDEAMRDCLREAAAKETYEVLLDGYGPKPKSFRPYEE